MLLCCKTFKGSSHFGEANTELLKASITQLKNYFLIMRHLHKKLAFEQLTWRTLWVDKWILVTVTLHKSLFCRKRVVLWLRNMTNDYILMTQVDDVVPAGARKFSSFLSNCWNKFVKSLRFLIVKPLNNLAMQDKFAVRSLQKCMRSAFETNRFCFSFLAVVIIYR